MVLLIILFVIFLILLGLSFLYCFIKEKEYKKNQVQHVQKNSVYTQQKKDNTIKNKKNIIIKIGSFLKLSSFYRLTSTIVSYIPSHTIRNIIYKYLFRMKLGKRVTIYYGVEIRAPWAIKIGDGTIIGDKALLDGRSGLNIGKNVQLSTGVWIYTAQHDVNDPEFGPKDAPVNIEDRAWLSTRTIILPGVTIKEGAVVAAGAVVTKNLEPYSINGGVPAKFINKRNDKLTYEFSGERFHFL